MIDPDLNCQQELRREAVRGQSLNGLDYVEVSDDQLILHIVFLGKAPPDITKENIRISGGRRIRDIQVTSIRVNRESDPELDDSMDVTVNKPGDFSSYALSVIVVRLDENGQPVEVPMEGFDPRYDEVSFTFKAGCPSDLDCKAPPVCPPPTRTQPDISYLAKDYQSFRQLILDRLALTMPDWQETHAPDLGIALVELLAYVGDYLSYYQDAVATEAYLGTARQRISVRRHARLVDYQVHEGCNARTWVTIKVDNGNGPLDPKPISLDPKQIYFITGFSGAPTRHVLQHSDLQNVPSGSYEVFESLVENPSQAIYIYQTHSEISFYTWGDCECCLARSSTSATLTDHWVPDSTVVPGRPTAKATTTSGEPPGTVRALGNLKVGDVLIFEEVIGPKTGNPADADPTHRQAVRLTKVTPTVDPLYHQEEYPNYGWPVVEIEWCSEDALTFPLCISAQAPPPDCSCTLIISIARGNVILVDNGETAGEPIGTVSTQSTVERCTDCGPADIVTVPGPFRPTLNGKPLTFSEPQLPCGCASALIAQDPRQALPQISLVGIPAAPNCPESEPSPCQIPPLFTFADLDNSTALARKLKSPTDPAAQFLDALLSSSTKQLLSNWDGTGFIPDEVRRALVKDLTALLETWHPKSDLLESGPDDADFVVEMDNDGYAHLRFGDGDLGRMPAAGTAFQATYRVGIGPAGNVGAGTISYLVFFGQLPDGAGNLTPCNPLPAMGGTAPEAMAEVKLFAPAAFRDVLERAIVGDDYAALAQDNARRLAERPSLLAAMSDNPDADPIPGARGSVPRAAVEEEPGGKPLLGPNVCLAPFRRLQGAKGTLRWTGSWYEALVAVDPLGEEEADPELLAEISAYLEPYRRMGHDLEVKPAQYVPLDLVLTVCVLPQYLRGHVEAALLDVLSNRVLPDGRLGFFHPDNLTFGEGISVSRIVGAAQAVPGVQNVQVTRLERYEIGEPPPGAESAQSEIPPHGVLSLAPFEIAQLDNDPSFPENGRFILDMRGGR
jgi:hypothetical protein